jgi:hypothetical protein
VVNCILSLGVVQWARGRKQKLEEQGTEKFGKEECRFHVHSKSDELFWACTHVICHVIRLVLRHTPREIASGVPQGSVLAPLLCNLYINVPQAAPETHLALFADGICIHFLIRRIRTSLCSNKLKPGCHYDHIYRYKRRQKAVRCSLLSSISTMGRSG